MKEATAAATKPVAVEIKLRLRNGVDEAFSAWHAKMCSMAAQLPGCINAEVNAPEQAEPSVWRIVHRFRSQDTVRAWLQSDEHRQLMREAESLVDKGDIGALVEVDDFQDPDEATVTEVISTHVRPDKAEEYRQWAAKVHKAEAQFPGYRGGFLQPPTSPEQPYWTTLVRFATPEQLETWLNSQERQALLQEHKDIVSSFTEHRLPTSFAGWFPQDHASGGGIPEWKQSMVVVLMLFPIVMAELRFLTPLTSGLKPAVGTFIGNVLSVVLLAWPFMPLAIRALKWWLMPGENKGASIHFAGTALVLALYAAEIAFFWRWLT